MNWLAHGAEIVHRAVSGKRFIVAKGASIIGLLLVVGPAWAGLWSSSYSITYQLGDRDSKSTLRRIALDEARTKAASEVGIVVLNEQELKDDRLFEQTKLVSAALIKLKVVKEAARVSGDQAYIDFEIRAEVDDSELDRQLSAMRVDVRKTDLIVRLSRENAALRRRMESLRMARSNLTDEAALDSVANEMESSSVRLAAIERQTSLVLSGTELVDHAVEQDASEAALVESVVIRPLLRSRVQVDMKPWRKNGDMIEVPVVLAWEFDVEAMKRAAYQFSTPRGLRGSPLSKGFCAATETAPAKQSAAGRQLLSDAVAIEVTLGGSRSYFAIGGEGDLGHFCVVDGSFSAPRTVVLSLPESEARAVGSISVKTVRMSNVAPGWKSMLRNDLLVGGM
jgi:hypothetical protein